MYNFLETHLLKILLVLPYSLVANASGCVEFYSSDEERRGWAMVLGNLVPGLSTNLQNSMATLTVLAVGEGAGYFKHFFSLAYHISFLFPSLWERI